MYPVDTGKVPRVKQANIQHYDQSLESTAAITHKNCVVHCEGACGNYARVLRLATPHWMFPKYHNRRTASSSLGQFRKGTRRCLQLSHTTHKTTFRTTFPRLQTGSHSTKFPLRDGGLSLCIYFWKLTAFRKWNSEHSGQNATQTPLLFTTSTLSQYCEFRRSTLPFCVSRLNFKNLKELSFETLREKGMQSRNCYDN